MTAQFVFSNDPALDYTAITPLLIRTSTAVTSFTMDIANLSAAEPESGTPLQSRLLDGQTWELPVLTTLKQKIDTLPNLVIAGKMINRVFYTWHDLLVKWHYARSRWIVTDDFLTPTKVVRSNEALAFEQFEGINFAVRASIEFRTAGVQNPATGIPFSPVETTTILSERSVQPWASQAAIFNSPEPVRAAELIQDIVFTRYEKGKELFSFNIAPILKTLAPTFEEIAVTSPIGKAGTGIWKILGDLPLFANDRYTINALKRLSGLPFGMQVLYKTGRCTGTVTLNSVGQLDSTSGANNGYCFDRFNNLVPYRNQMGIVFQVRDESAGYRREHLLISGATAEKADYQMQSPAAFYALFKKLNVNETH